MHCGACPGTVGGGGTVQTSLLLAAYIHGSVSPAPFPAICRGTPGAGIRTGLVFPNFIKQIHAFIYLLLQLPMHVRDKHTQV